MTEQPRLPSPFSTPPCPELQAARGHAPLPPGFRGRAGVLLTQDAGGCVSAGYAFEPHRQPVKVKSWKDVKAAKLWPMMSEAAVPSLQLVNAAGGSITLKGFLEWLFSDYPRRSWNQGGRQVEERKAGWRWAVTDALKSPSVVLLSRWISRGCPGTPVGLAEWWEGAPPVHEIRHGGAFYPPRGAARELIRWMLSGVSLEEAAPLCSRETASGLRILYEDWDVLVVNKPSRLASVPGVREYFSAKSVLEETYGELFVVHRLDVDTSGVLAFARTRQALAVMNDAFRNGLACKRYEARLEGELEAPSGTVELPLALNLLDRPRQCVIPESEGAKNAVTHYESAGTVTAPSGRRKSLVNLWLETGRTHQLRVHCAHGCGLGIPIDGDPFYGSLGLLAEDRSMRLCLHAAELTVPHPTNGGILHIEAPSDFPLF